MHHNSKIAAIAVLLVLLLTSATPDVRNRVLMRVGGSTATIGDYCRLFGADSQPGDTTLSLLAINLRKLEDARITLGRTVTDTTFMLGRMVEQGQALHDITEFRTAAARSDSEARDRFFNEHRCDFKWSEPHFIGSIVLAESQEVADGAADFLRRVTDGVFVDIATVGLNTPYGKEIRVVNYNVARHRNPFVDYAVFGATEFPRVEQWKAAAVVKGKIVEQPQCADDAGELFITVFTDTLISRWTDSLSKVMPVETDNKALEILKAL